MKIRPASNQESCSLCEVDLADWFVLVYDLEVCFDSSQGYSENFSDGNLGFSFKNEFLIWVSFLIFFKLEFQYFTVEKNHAFEIYKVGTFYILGFLEGFHDLISS